MVECLDLHLLLLDPKVEDYSDRQHPLLHRHSGHLHHHNREDYSVLRLLRKDPKVEDLGASVHLHRLLHRHSGHRLLVLEMHLLLHNSSNNSNSNNNRVGYSEAVLLHNSNNQGYSGVLLLRNNNNNNREDCLGVIQLLQWGRRPDKHKVRVKEGGRWWHHTKQVERQMEQLPLVFNPLPPWRNMNINHLKN
jgi:hypothetical protein